MARSIWTGAVSFGLVNVPVKAYSAVRDHDVHFHQLDRRSGARIRYRKVSEKTGREVDDDHIDLGFEVSDGRYVTFTRDELDELRPDSTRTIDVADFVPLSEVDPIYFERTYWLAPADDPARRPYHLLVAAMEDRGLVGLGTVAMRNKQYLCAVRPLDGALAMSTMRFADEVVAKRDVDAIPTRRTKPDRKMLTMATRLIDALTVDFDPKRYHDTYEEELRQRIEAKDAGEEIVKKEKPADDGKVVDLAEALQASVDAAKSGRRRSHRRRKAS